MSIGYLLTMFTTSLLLEMLNCSFTWQKIMPFEWPCWYYCYYSTMVSVIMECQFISLVHMIRHRFKIINTKLLSFKPTVTYNKKQNYRRDNFTLKILQKCYTDLSDCCRKLNKIFTITLLIDIAYIFLQSTLCYRDVFHNLKAKNNNHKEIITTFIWGCYYLIRLLILTKSCHVTIKEVGIPTFFLTFNLVTKLYC